jgi:hypothetical protein
MLSSIGLFLNSNDVLIALIHPCHVGIQPHRELRSFDRDKELDFLARKYASYGMADKRYIATRYEIMLQVSMGIYETRVISHNVLAIRGKAGEIV